VNQGVPRKITVSGGQTQVAYAVQLIQNKMFDLDKPGGAMGSAGVAIDGFMRSPPSTTLDCPKPLIGRIIGKGGETINDIQTRSGARVQIEQKVPEGMPCKVGACIPGALILS
jgi:far upstream element-binding protein